MPAPLTSSNNSYGSLSSRHCPPQNAPSHNAPPVATYQHPHTRQTAAPYLPQHVPAGYPTGENAGLQPSGVNTRLPSLLPKQATSKLPVTDPSRANELVKCKKGHVKARSQFPNQSNLNLCFDCGREIAAAVAQEQARINTRNPRRGGRDAHQQPTFTVQPQVPNVLNPLSASSRTIAPPRAPSPFTVGKAEAKRRELLAREKSLPPNAHASTRSGLDTAWNELRSDMAKHGFEFERDLQTGAIVHRPYVPPG